MKIKFQISDEDLDILEEIIPLQQPYKAGKPWKFAGAFYYATTVLTTIGRFICSSGEGGRGLNNNNIYINMILQVTHL